MDRSFKFLSIFGFNYRFYKEVYRLCKLGKIKFLKISFL